MYNTQFETVIKQALTEETSVHSAGLSQKIITAIEKRKRAGVITRLVLFGFTTLLSLVGSALVWRSAGQAFAVSEAGQMLALLFSDFTIVVGYWREYLSSLAESIPFVSVAMVGALVWAALASVYQVIKNSFVLIHSAVWHG